MLETISILFAIEHCYLVTLGIITLFLGKMNNR